MGKKYSKMHSLYVPSLFLESPRYTLTHYSEDTDNNDKPIG